MEIDDLRRGTRLAFFKEDNQRATGSAYRAEFRYVESELLFVVDSLSIYNSFDDLAASDRLIIAFEIGPMLYTFAGRISKKKSSPHLIVVEQTGAIKEFNRRKREREELLFSVEIFDLPPENMKSGNFEALTADTLLHDSTYDISTSGMCIFSDIPLKSKFEPFFLIRLVISAKDTFIVPAKLVRRNDLKRAGLGRYEYGFQFIYDNLPNMEKRLTEAIMLKKLG